MIDCTWASDETYIGPFARPREAPQTDQQPPFDGLQTAGAMEDVTKRRSDYESKPHAELERCKYPISKLNHQLMKPQCLPNIMERSRPSASRVSFSKMKTLAT